MCWIEQPCNKKSDNAFHLSERKRMLVDRHALHCYCFYLTWEIYPITKK